MQYRMATQKDLTQLEALRWDSRSEDGAEEPAVSRDRFVQVCIEFFERGLKCGTQTQWVALDGKEIVAIERAESTPLGWRESG